ncbi:hypothetical protein AAFC00_004392 [Neodothiora populina]
MVPGLAAGAVGTVYDWNFTYASNPDLYNREVSIPLGHVVGGGSLLNILLFDRGSKGDYNLWEKFGAKGWGWKDILPFFKKSETFTPPSAEQIAEWNITYDPKAHGYDGPVRSSYSPYYFPSLHYFEAGLKEIGVSTPLDGANGEALGGFATTHAQDLRTQTRVTARTAYWDNANNRTNLHLLTNTRVTKLISSPGKNGSAKVTGVEFAATKDSPRHTVGVNMEAVMAAGAIHTPQILQLSGIGNPALLQKFNISTVADVPGVGYNFQDHGMMYLKYNLSISPQSGSLKTNTTLAADALAQYKQSRTGPYTTSTDDYLVYLPIKDYQSNTSSIFTLAANQTATTYFDSDTPASVLAGYETQYDLLIKTLNSSSIAALEIIWNDNSMIIAGQHPLSRGSVKIQSTDPFAAPIADAAYLRNPIDAAVLSEGIKFLRRVMGTEAVASISPVEIQPGSNVTSNADLDAYVRQSITTEFHPSGSCSIGPFKKGGVVDHHLRVYGVENLRVVDASVQPLIPASHIQSTVYAVAEKAADIIRKDNTDSYRSH